MTKCRIPEKGHLVLGDGTILRPFQFLDGWWAEHPGAADKAGLTVLASMEPFLGEQHGDLLHVSVSRPNRLPNWRDLRIVKDLFFGDDVEAVIVLPKKAEYVNIHENCHHLWEIPDGLWERPSDFAGEKSDG